MNRVSFFHRYFFFLAIFSSVLFLIGLPPVLGADYVPPRVSSIEGKIAYEPAGDVDWNEVTVNLPLLGGDRVLSQPDARMEIDLGYANFIRIGEETELAVVSTNEDETTLELPTGEMIVRMNRGDRVRIFTPGGTITIEKKGLYRINVDPSGRTEVSVRKGKATLENAFGRETVSTNEQIIVPSPQSPPQEVEYAYFEDNLDIWSSRRDARLVSSQSAAYVGGVYYPGIWDLDYHGYWDYYPGYGRVWIPRVAAGWAPFRHGSWLSFSFGWTWVSYEPWGWLPYHYGDWIYHRSRWCWVPGGFHYWSPATVSFYWGDGWVGWAPRGYRHGGYYNRNTVIINNNTTIINQDNRRGLTVVRQDDFGRGVSGGRRSFSGPENNFTANLRDGLPPDLKAGNRSRTRLDAGSSERAVNRSARPAGVAGSRSIANSGTTTAFQGSTPATGLSTGRTFSNRVDRSGATRGGGSSIAPSRSNGTVSVGTSKASSPAETRQREVRSYRAGSDTGSNVGENRATSRTTTNRQPETRTYRVGERPANTNRTPEVSGTSRPETSAGSRTRSSSVSEQRRSSAGAGSTVSRDRSVPTDRNLRSTAPSTKSRSVAPSVPRSSQTAPRSVAPSKPRSSPSVSRGESRPSVRSSAPASRPASSAPKPREKN